jgi:hypothetical protein
VKWFEGQRKSDYLKLIDSQNASLITENYDKTFSTVKPKSEHVQKLLRDRTTNIITNNNDGSFCESPKIKRDHLSVSLAGIEPMNHSNSTDEMSASFDKYTRPNALRPELVDKYIKTVLKRGA